MKRFVLHALAVTMMVLGSGQVAHSRGALCVVKVPNPFLLGLGGGPGSCSLGFSVQGDGMYTIELTAGPAANGDIPGTTGEFRARVSSWDGTHIALDIRARFVAGVLVDGASSSSAELSAGSWSLAVWYSDQQLPRVCLLDPSLCVPFSSAGFGEVIGSVR